MANDTACAAIHSGWRGLEAGVISEGIAAVRALGTGKIKAIIGPCISPAHYEFGVQDLDRLASIVGPSVIGETSDGSPALDLRAGIRSALLSEGVTDIGDDLRCTFSEQSLFSFRRDGVTGRQGMVVERVR
jgi:copper oxidase (laccase) domain-containing protein